MTRLPGMDRRAFLALGVGAAAWACSKKGDDDSAQAVGGAISLVPTAQVGLAVGDSRQAVAVFRGERPFVPDSLDVRLFPPKGRSVEVDAQRQSVVFGLGGDDPADESGTEVTDIFTITHELDRGGVWGIEARVGEKRARTVFQVLGKGQAPAPIIGEQALASQSPTQDNPRGVDPICTRRPRCSMHDMTIADALGAGRPAVLTFATPKFCTSRTCGPVVDIVETAKEKFGNEASFIHVEVWRNEEVVGKPGGDSPTFLEWKLGTEPWVYFVGADGGIKDRWLGALGSRELRRAVEKLAG